MFDSDSAQLQNALHIARTNATQLRQHGLYTDSVDLILRRIYCESNLERAVCGVDLVIETVPGKIQFKRHILTHLDRLCTSETIIAINSSTFVPSDLAVGLLHDERKKRVLVMHFWNPAHLMPLVEVVPHPHMTPPVFDTVKTLLIQCGKTPVVMRTEIPGLIGNRLVSALLREAMDLVAKGVATPEDIDLVAKASFGRRIPVTGIFGTADIDGLDASLEICRGLFPNLCNETAPPPMLSRLVEQGNLGVISGSGWSQYSPEHIAPVHESLAMKLLSQLLREQGSKRTET